MTVLDLLSTIGI